MSLRLATGLRNEMMKAGGQSMADAMITGSMYIYEGTQPADPDATENSTLLVKITLSSLPKVPGVGANGISLGQILDGVLKKAIGETWSGVAGAGGVAGWFRFYDIDETTGGSSTVPSFDGSIGTSGADLNMSNTTITNGGTTTIDSVALTLPVQ